eukprot:2091748-Pleurochrysis_carterae.AAC.1
MKPLVTVSVHLEMPSAAKHAWPLAQHSQVVVRRSMSREIYSHCQMEISSIMEYPQGGARCFPISVNNPYSRRRAEKEI